MLKRPDGAVLGWFDVGIRFFESGGHDPDQLPPLMDREAQRAWIAGFGAAWCEWPEHSVDTFDDPRNGSIMEALAHTLSFHSHFLHTLLMIQKSRNSARLHTLGRERCQDWK